MLVPTFELLDKTGAQALAYINIESCRLKPTPQVCMIYMSVVYIKQS